MSQVKEVIEHLGKLDPEEPIIAIWWTRDSFPQTLNDEEWKDTCELQWKIDWSGANDDLDNFIEYRIKG